MKRAFVFIDGNNFYFKLKELKSKLNHKYYLLDFKFREFSEWLVNPNNLIEIYYYLGVIRRRKDDALSSDTDLVAAVEEVQSIGKDVYYIGIPKGQSFGLSKAADDVRLLRLEEMKQFFPEVLLK